MLGMLVEIAGTKQMAAAGFEIIGLHAPGWGGRRGGGPEHQHQNESETCPLHTLPPRQANRQNYCQSNRNIVCPSRKPWGKESSSRGRSRGPDRELRRASTRLSFFQYQN